MNNMKSVFYSTTREMNSSFFSLIISEMDIVISHLDNEVDSDRVKVLLNFLNEVKD